MQGGRKGRVPPPTTLMYPPHPHQLPPALYGPPPGVPSHKHRPWKHCPSHYAYDQESCDVTDLGLGTMCSRTDKITTVLHLYKTKICKNWKTYGECRYENKCMFAHGEEELRTVSLSEEESIQQFESAGVRVYITPQQAGVR